jgi:hypothetical protein
MSASVPQSVGSHLTITSDELYCCADIERYPVGENLELVYLHDTHTSHILNSDAVNILVHCRDFKPLDDHVRNCRKFLGDTYNIASIKKDLVELVDRGLLYRYRELIDRIRYSAAREMEFSHSSVRIQSIGCPTRDRLESLQRCLVSYIDNNKQHERSSDYVVVDDTRGQKKRADCRQMLKSLKKAYGVNISYAGLEEKLLFAKRLIDTNSLPPGIVNFALFDVEKCGLVTTAGANRNALFLHTVGDPVLVVDDDTICKIGIAPGTNNDLAIISGMTPAEENWIFPDRTSALASVEHADLDILALHEQLLGKGIFSCISEFSNKASVDFNGSAPSLLRRMAKHNGSVSVTINGMIGDCRWGFPSYLFLSGDSLNRLTESESRYHANCTSREMLQVAKQTVITDAPNSMMATFFGLDNRELVPPNLPIGRGQDHLFGITLSKCFPDGYFAYLPWTLQHLPLEPRKFWRGEIHRRASGIDILTLFESLIRPFNLAPDKMDRNECLCRLGKYLEEIASMKNHDFYEFIRLQVWNMISSAIMELEDRIIQHNNSPDFWVNDLRKFIKTLRDSLQRQEFSIPLDILYGRSLDEARELSKRLVLKFGQLLYWWPEIVKQTQRLRIEGTRLAQPI